MWLLDFFSHFTPPGMANTKPNGHESTGNITLILFYGKLIGIISGRGRFIEMGRFLIWLLALWLHRSTSYSTEKKIPSLAISTLRQTGMCHKPPLWPWGGRLMTVANSNTMGLNSTQIIKIYQKSNQFWSAFLINLIQNLVSWIAARVMKSDGINENNLPGIPLNSYTRNLFWMI